MLCRLGNKVVEVSDWKEVDGRRIPVIKARTEERKNPDGSVDVVVHVPYLQIAGGEQLTNKGENNG